MIRKKSGRFAYLDAIARRKLQREINDIQQIVFRYERRLSKLRNSLYSAEFLAELKKKNLRSPKKKLLMNSTGLLVDKENIGEKDFLLLAKSFYKKYSEELFGGLDEETE